MAIQSTDFILLNEAIGGTLGGSITGLTQATAGPAMTVDYVRWYSAQ
jgi:hypothetical protein